MPSGTRRPRSTALYWQVRLSTALLLKLLAIEQPPSGRAGCNAAGKRSTRLISAPAGLRVAARKYINGLRMTLQKTLANDLLQTIVASGKAHPLLRKAGWVITCWLAPRCALLYNGLLYSASQHHLR